MMQRAASGLLLAILAAPTQADEILERIPVTVTDGRVRELRALRDSLSLEPDNLTLAIQPRREYIEPSRVSSDPRYSGYAQGALAFW